MGDLPVIHFITKLKSRTRNRRQKCQNKVTLKEVTGVTVVRRVVRSFTDVKVIFQQIRLGSR